MTVCVETEAAPTAAQVEAWRRLWSLLLLDNHAPEQSPDGDAAGFVNDNADADANALD